MLNKLFLIVLVLLVEVDAFSQCVVCKTTIASSADHKSAEAYNIYQQQVSGKPLEGLELYWMGKLMQELKKGYNAKQFLWRCRS